MMKATNNDAEFVEQGIDGRQDAVNAHAEEIKEPPVERQAFDPLGDAVNVKSYAKSGATINAKDANTPIPEPVFTPPPIAASTQSEPVVEAPKQPQKPINPQMTELPPKEKSNAAKQAAAMAINGYEFLHQLANNGVKVGEKKLSKLTRDGHIDLSLPVQIGTNIVPMSQWMAVYNEQVGDTFTVSEEFKKEVTPVLERVLEKKGIGATDEQMLIYLVAKDASMKAIQFAGLFKQRKEMINQLKDLTEQWRTQNKMAAQNQPQPQQQAPPPQSNTYSPPPPPPDFANENIPLAEEVREDADFGSRHNYAEPSGNVMAIVDEPSPVVHEITEAKPEKSSTKGNTRVIRPSHKPTGSTPAKPTRNRSKK